MFLRAVKTCKRINFLVLVGGEEGEAEKIENLEKKKNEPLSFASSCHNARHGKENVAHEIGHISFKGADSAKRQDVAGAVTLLLCFFL